MNFHINYVKNAGVAYADVLFDAAADCVLSVFVYDLHNNLINSAEKSFAKGVAGIRLALTALGEITIKAVSKSRGEVTRLERTVYNTPSFADASEIALAHGSRLDESRRVGLGYIMGIDLPRLIAPSYEVHGLTLRYTAADNAVKCGDKAVGEAVKRYGGWEAKGGWKLDAPDEYTLAGEQLGHWLSAAAVFYNAMKNEPQIMLTAASQNGADTSDAAPTPKSDAIITPADIHTGIEYAINALAALQNTKIPHGVTTVVHKEYIGGCDETPFLRCFDAQDAWESPYWVPWYNIHKIYQGLLDVYDYAEPQTAHAAFGVLKKLADWAVRGTHALSDIQMQRMLGIEHGGMNEIFARMYEITADKSYLDTARRFTHDAVINPLVKNDTDSLCGRHANTQIPKFIGAARIYEQNRDAYSEYRTACENFWRNVNYERCYAIGGNSLNEHFQHSGTEELGVKTCESCNTYNMMRLTEQLFAWEHKSEYMDWYERALCNHVLGQQEPHTGAKMYFVSMVQGTHRIYEQKYNAWWCCTGTGMENPARYTRAAFFEDADDLYINLYFPCEYKWEHKNLTFKIETEYPYAETVKITVSGEGGASLLLRAPHWIGERMSVSVNGDIRAESDGGEYIRLENISAGDEIIFCIPMQISVYKSRDNQRIAYEYGPLVLAAKLSGRIKHGFEYIWEERNTACCRVAYPVLKTTDGKGINTADDLTKYLTKSDGLRFTLAADRNSTCREIELLPFADIPHGYHNIYFDIDSEIDAYAINLSNVTTDYVDPDAQQSELGHGMAQSSAAKTPYRANSYQCADAYGQYRTAVGADGFFKYNMLFDRDSDRNYLLIRYRADDTAVDINGRTYSVNYRIFADGTELTAKRRYTDINGMTDMLTELPQSVLSASAKTDASTGLGIVTIMLVPSGEGCAVVPYRRMYTLTDIPQDLGGYAYDKNNYEK